MRRRSPTRRASAREFFDVGADGLAWARTALRIGTTAVPAGGRVDVVQHFDLFAHDLLARDLEVYETAGVTVILIVY